MQLEPLAGQDEERRLPDVQDRVADPLEELRDEEIRDDERRILMRLGEASKRFLQGVAILAIELELAAAGVLRLVGARVGEGGDDLVERGERDPGRAGQVERDRTGFQARDVNRLLGDGSGPRGRRRGAGVSARRWAPRPRCARSTSPRSDRAGCRPDRLSG